MGVGERDRVLVVTDAATRRIGEALALAAGERGAIHKTVALEQFGRRPFLTAPDALLRTARHFAPSVSFFAAQGLPGEIGLRMALMKVLLQELKVRHGHMIGIETRLIDEGMQADYQQVAALTRRLHALVSRARRITARNDAGTALTAEFSPALRWQPCTGIYHRQGEWGNLPEGELFTCPLRVDGVLAGQVVGDYFSEKYGVLPQPLLLELRDSRLVSLSGGALGLADELEAYLRGSANGDRVGEFAIGANTALTTLSGNLLQDEKIPGIHLAFGNPYPEETGASWNSPIHVDVVSAGGEIELDGRPLMRDGRFVAEAVSN